MHQGQNITFVWPVKNISSQPRTQATFTFHCPRERYPVTGISRVCLIKNRSFRVGKGKLLFVTNCHKQWERADPSLVLSFVQASTWDYFTCPQVSVPPDRAEDCFQCRPTTNTAWERARVYRSGKHITTEIKDITRETNKRVETCSDVPSIEVFECKKTPCQENKNVTELQTDLTTHLPYMVLFFVFWFFLDWNVPKLDTSATYGCYL